MTRKLSYKDYYNMCGEEFQDGDQISVKLVVVLGDGKDYAIYLGTTDMSDDEVAQNGDKIYQSNGKKVADAVFHSATYKRFYRR